MNITEGQLDFKTFEGLIFKIMCQIACELMREYLEWRDLGVMASRDTKEYRLIDIRETTVKTIMGEVRYSRRYYRGSDGKYVFLLDEAMGISSGCGLISENLAEQIVAECMEKSFRKAAQSINSLTGQSISAQGAWDVVQQYSGQIEQQVERLEELGASDSAGHLGNISSSMLFVEYDDVWISRQKETRQRRGDTVADAGEQTEAADGKKHGKKQEKKLGKKPMHVGTAYTGWKQSKDGRYSTVNKIAYATFGSAFGFTSSFETLMRNCYDMDGIERQVTNGDGAQWIRTESEFKDSILQLDPYHRSEAIIKAVAGKNARELLFGAIREKDVEGLLSTICELAVDADNEPEQKRLTKLYGYFYDNKDIILTWKERGIKLPTPPEGITYRELGTQESSNCSLLTQRMKHRKGSWTEQGANHMAKILCFRNTIGLDTILCSLPEPGDAKPWLEPLSAAKAPQYDGKGYGADWLHAEMPFDNAFKTHGREVIRNMLRAQPLAKLHFI